jgi:hypothetical protein
MLKKKNIVVSFALVFILLGCGSDSQKLDSESQNLERVSSPMVEEKPSNWYIRLVAEDPARALKSVGTQLGQLDEMDAVEKHTLEALTPFEGTYLDIVFEDPVGVSAGDYKVNFHTYEEGMEDRWQFTVRTDDANANVLLSWRGVYILTPYIDDQNRQRYNEYYSMTNPLNKYMKLVDSSNGIEMAAVVNGEVQTYSFNMNGQTERTFEWVVETDEVSIPAQASKLLSVTAKAVQKDATIDKEAIINKRTEKFDLNQPPIYSEEQ